jgi:hypothetical protein
MKDKGIITRVKKKFLASEKQYFSNMTNKEYKEIMSDDADKCEQCGIWSWSECAKRCSCNK